jgi:hypothetical protein
MRFSLLENQHSGVKNVTAAYQRHLEPSRRQPHRDGNSNLENFRLVGGQIAQKFGAFPLDKIHKLQYQN